MTKVFIYKITNLINGKCYIGQTIRTVKERWTEHCKPYNGKFGKLLIDLAIRKYGKEKFEVKTIYKASSIEDLNKKEQFYIKKLKTMGKDGYNLTTGGDNYIRSEETKKKISLSQIGPKNHRYGKKASKETRRKQSESHKGEKNNFYGKTHTPKVRKIISDMMKKRGNGQLGLKRSKSTRKKLSENQKGKIPGNARPIICNENGKNYRSIAEAGRQLKLGPSSIYDVLKGKLNQTKGYSFSYFQTKKTIKNNKL